MFAVRGATGISPGTDTVHHLYYAFVQKSTHIWKHIHMYADDTQLYVSYDVTDQEQGQEVTEKNCISDIQSWMVTNKLQLNSNKTELHVLGSYNFTKHI